MWVAGEPHAVGPSVFAGTSRGGRPALLARGGPRPARELLVMRSDYEQPFGTFSGELPVAGPLREGWGVMERHEVFW